MAVTVPDVKCSAQTHVSPPCLLQNYSFNYKCWKDDFTLFSVYQFSKSAILIIFIPVVRL